MSKVHVDNVDSSPSDDVMADIHHLIQEKGIEEVRRVYGGTPGERQAIEAAFAILGDEEARMGITHAGFAMANLPHKRIDTAVWSRESGTVKLMVESGRNSDESLVGIPYGPLARIVLLYLQTQAIKTRSREVELGRSMHSWLARMGVSKGGKTYALVREQTTRISRARLTFFNRIGDAEVVRNGAFVRDSIFLSKSDNQESLWTESVTLDESYFASLMSHSLPLRETAIRHLSTRSMAIDVYIWLAYRLHVLKQPVFVPWAALKSQFGNDYKEIRFFKRDARVSLELALAVYPEAKVEIDPVKGVMLHPSLPPVREKHLQLS